jgi:hypothetical protein
MRDRLRYWRRIGSAYLLADNSALTFWHERPAAEPSARFDALGPYYMTFADKAAYPGPFDASGTPLLDYHGDIGRRYNPIAIAQYGLAHFNAFACTGAASARTAFLRQADWLVENLRPNQRGVCVWMHDFDFEYRTTLRAPWYSGLAQGQGVSLLARAYRATGDERYAAAMTAAYAAFERTVEDGGVMVRDGADLWIEEYLVDPPTHILNGFIWALWGVKDYALCKNSAAAEELFARCVGTLKRNLSRYDAGYWSLYELSGTAIPMLASHFYHRLHIVQLDILAAMTGRDAFAARAARWRGYASRPLNRAASFAQKCAFKVLYY